DARRRIGLSEPGIFDMHGPVWTTGQYKYQEWYLGSTDVKTSTGMEAEEEGKKGFINDEEWIRPPGEIKAMLKRLIESGVEIGVATGRPRQETLIPFHQQRFMDVFRNNRVSTASEGLALEGVGGAAVSRATPPP